MGPSLLKRLRGVFTLEQIVCRLLAAWLGYTAWTLVPGDGFWQLSYAQDTSWWSLLLWVALLFVFYSSVALWLSAVSTDSWLLLAGATACITQWLVTYDGGNDRFAFILAVTAAYIPVVLYFLKKNGPLWKRWEPHPKAVWCGVILFALFGGGVIAVISCLRYVTFATPNFDFGLFVNMFHNMKETGLPLATAERDVLLSHFAVHISPIYYVLLPFYMVFPSPLTLQIGQAVVLASGVIPVTLLCRRFRLSEKATLLVGFIYSLYPVLAAGCFYDIHENCFLTPLLLWLFYCFEERKYGWMYLCALLTLMVKEDAAIYVALFALYVLLSQKKKGHGWILLTGALAYFGAALWILHRTGTYYAEFYADATPNPAIDGPMIDRFGNLIQNEEDGLLGAVKTALVNPGFLLTQLFGTGDGGWGKLMYVIQLFLPLGGLPLCRSKPSRWLLCASVLLNLVTTYPYQFDIGYQYNFGITAFLMYAAVMNLSEIRGALRRNLLGIAAAACCCMHLAYVWTCVSVNYNNWQVDKENHIRMAEVLDAIPEEASVSCSTFLLARVADRDEVYEVAYHGSEYDVDYVIYDRRYEIDEQQMADYLENGYTIQTHVDELITVLVKDGVSR